MRQQEKRTQRLAQQPVETEVTKKRSWSHIIVWPRIKRKREILTGQKQRNDWPPTTQHSSSTVDQSFSGVFIHFSIAVTFRILSLFSYIISCHHRSLIHLIYRILITNKPNKYWIHEILAFVWFLRGISFEFLGFNLVLQWKVDRVTANHSLSSTAIQQKFQHSLSLLSFSWDVTARHKISLEMPVQMLVSCQGSWNLWCSSSNWRI